MLSRPAHRPKQATQETWEQASSSSSSIISLVDFSLLADNEFVDDAVRNAHKVYEHLIALWAPAILEAAYDLRVFEGLARGPLQSKELAKMLQIEERGMRILLDALYTYRFIERTLTRDDEHIYSLTPDMQQCLVQGELYSLVGKFIYDRRLAWDAWQNLAQAVRTGSGQSGCYSQNQISEADYQFLVGGINFWAPPAISALCRGLHEIEWSTEKAVSVLDVGCGTGLYSQLLLQKFPHWTAQGLDSERIAPLALAQSKQLEVDTRFTCTVCDLWQHDWGENQDLILFANIFHLQNRESAQQLLSLAARSLAKNGLICIIDHILDEHRSANTPQSRFALLFAASMLATGGGDAYTTKDFDDWLGVAHLRRLEIWNTPMHRILIATHDS